MISTQALLFEPDGSWAKDLIAQFSGDPDPWQNDGVALTRNTPPGSRNARNPSMRHRKNNLSTHHESPPLHHESSSLQHESPVQQQHESYTTLSPRHSTRRNPHIRQRNPQGPTPEERARKLTSNLQKMIGHQQPEASPKSPELRVRITVERKVEISSALLSQPLPTSTVTANVHAFNVRRKHSHPRAPSPNCSIQHATRRSNDEECPICIQSLTNTSLDMMVWCKGSCGRNIHRACFETWREYADRPVRCVIWYVYPSYILPLRRLLIHVQSCGLEKVLRS
jgi:hypothetical protein